MTFWREKTERMNEVKLPSNVSDSLELIMKLPLSLLGRAGNMMWMGFGQVDEVIDKRGRKGGKAEFFLNVQSGPLSRK